MKKGQALAALATSAAKARDNTGRPFKLRNLNLYYSHLLMECYYFYQQCKDYFKITELLGHKRISFAIDFLKDHILN